jgi:hypothetical protein
VFDDVTGTSTPVIKNIPGPSASLAYNPKTQQLYVGVGSDPGMGNSEIEAFGLSALDLAFANKTALGWTTTNNPGAGIAVPGTPGGTGETIGGGMFFDSRGDLFTGASDGLLVIDPSGNRFLYNGYNDQTYSDDPFSYPFVFFDQATLGTTDQFVMDFYDNSGTPLVGVYSADHFAVVPEPTTAALVLVGGGLLLAYARNRKRLTKSCGRIL